MSENDHWQIYLPVMVASFVLMLPAILTAEKHGRLKQVFVSAIALMLVAQFMFAGLIQSFWGIVISLTAYFLAFNILEASLPSIISKVAPAASKGTAIGVYNTAQSLGIFVGGAAGGYLSHTHGFAAVFIFCGILMACWLIFAVSMKTPPAIKNRMFRIANIRPERANEMRGQLAALKGVREVAVLPEEGMVILKVDMQQSVDEAQVREVLAGDYSTA